LQSWNLVVDQLGEQRQRADGDQNPKVGDQIPSLCKFSTNFKWQLIILTLTWVYYNLILLFSKFNIII
jgi:hypothetical protein